MNQNKFFLLCEIIAMLLIHTLLLYFFWITTPALTKNIGNPSIKIIYNILFQSVVLLPFLFIIKRKDEPFSLYFGTFNKNIKNLIGVFSSFVITGVIFVLSHIHNEIPAVFFHMILFFTVGFVEEYIFRGYFQHKLLLLFSHFKSPLFIATIAQSLFFSFSHFFINNHLKLPLDTYISSFIFSLILTSLHLLTGNLCLPIAIHWLNNILVLFRS